MKRLDPAMTKAILAIFVGGNGSEKTTAPARMGTTAPMAALKGMTNRARPREKAIWVKINAVR